MIIKTVDLGSENRIILTLDGVPVGVIDITNLKRVDYQTGTTYDAVELTGRGVEHRKGISSRFLGMFAASMSLAVREATVEGIEEVLIKS